MGRCAAAQGKGTLSLRTGVFSLFWQIISISYAFLIKYNAALGRVYVFAQLHWTSLTGLVKTLQLNFK
jgi:hypothetical protein